jgi:hypothetical protein
MKKEKRKERGAQLKVHCFFLKKKENGGEFDRSIDIAQ